MTSAPKPIYTSDNCRFAYQLRWGLTYFLRSAPADCDWFGEFATSLENNDSIRVLSHRWNARMTLQLSVSTQPTASPEFIVQQVKHRLSIAFDEERHRLIEPNDAIRSYGTQNRRLIESYIAKQHRHHRMATAYSNLLFSELAFRDPNVDLAEKQRVSRHTYWYCLHLVLVHAERWSHVHRERHQKVLEMVRRVSKTQSWRLASCAPLADHLHIALGCTLEVAPSTVALCLMNNLAFVYDMKAVYSNGAFIGTIGEYDQRSIRGSYHVGNHSLAANANGHWR